MMVIVKLDTVTKTVKVIMTVRTRLQLITPTTVNNTVMMQKLTNERRRMSCRDSKGGSDRGHDKETPQINKKKGDPST